jgi:hypothetical protein
MEIGPSKKSIGTDPCPTTKALFISTTASGVFEARGTQIAAERPNKWRAQLGIDGWRSFDVVVASKRIKPEWRKEIDIPIILDVMDFWQQPYHDHFFWTRDGAIKLLRKHIKTLKPDFVIPSTSAMATDMRREGLDQIAPSLNVIPHHWNPRIVERPFSEEKIRRVIYQGAISNIGEWENILNIHINPETVNETDIMISVRCSSKRSYMTRYWKPGAKAVTSAAYRLPLLWMEETGNADVLLGESLQPFSDLGEFNDRWHLVQDADVRRELWRKSGIVRERNSVSVAARKFEENLELAVNGVTDLP